MTTPYASIIDYGLTINKYVIMTSTVSNLVILFNIKKII